SIATIWSWNDMSRTVGTMNAPSKPAMPQDMTALARDLGRRARAAGAVLRTLPPARKEAGPQKAASPLRGAAAELLAAQAPDVEGARAEGRDAAFIDRLLLTAERVDGMARGLDDIVALPDPVGQTIEHWTRPNGLEISRVRVPIGTIAVIYES